MHGSLQQDGGGGGGGAVSCRGRIKEQVRLERKDKKEWRENYLYVVYGSVLMQVTRPSLCTCTCCLVSKSALLKFRVTLTESLDCNT